jgi:adenylate cyclase
MADNSTQRKLTAILSADVKGYSKLMGDDDEATVNAITAYRDIISELIQKHHGRVVDTPGDNILAEFGSALNAVNGAIDIQRTLKIENNKQPDDRRMDFRIGINLGDIIHKDERIYGDGVNVAARIESLADPGGICISRGVFDQVKKQIRLGFEYLGERAVKNISEPVRIYRLLLAKEYEGRVIGEPVASPKKIKKRTAMAIGVFLIVSVAMFWIYYFRIIQNEPATAKDKIAFKLPNKPSIAVLPFDNLSSDPDQEYLANGITENIITALSKIPEMLVISRNSVFTYKDKPIKVQQVGKDLGVRFVLEGSIQKSGDRLRITGQLIDATTDHHLWADQYDRKIEDLFAIQDEITMQIVSALQVELTEGEQARVRHRSTDSLRAWSYAVKGYSLYERITKDDNAEARELFKKSIDIDPEYAWAWTMLGNTYFIDTRYGWHGLREASYKKALECAEKALEIDGTVPDAHALVGVLKVWQKKYDEAIAAAESAIAFGPSDAESHAELGMLYRYVGRFEDSIRMTEKAIRLHPYYPDWYLYNLEYSYYYLGQYEKAIVIAKKHLELINKRGGTDTFWQHFILAQNYIRLGQVKEAKHHAAEGLRQNPEYTFKWEREGSMYKDPSLIEQQIEDLRKAGLTCEGE